MLSVAFCIHRLENLLQTPKLKFKTSATARAFPFAFAITSREREQRRVKVSVGLYCNFLMAEMVLLLLNLVQSFVWCVYCWHYARGYDFLWPVSCLVHMCSLPVRPDGCSEGDALHFGPAGQARWTATAPCRFVTVHPCFNFRNHITREGTNLGRWGNDEKGKRFLLYKRRRNLAKRKGHFACRLLPSPGNNAGSGCRCLAKWYFAEVNSKYLQLGQNHITSDKMMDTA